jgi:hypothetical protein
MSKEIIIYIYIYEIDKLNKYMIYIYIVYANENYFF